MSGASKEAFYVPTRDEFAAGLHAYKQNEVRAPVYFAALGQLKSVWGKPDGMADSIWLLLRSWHREFYQYGRVNLSGLAECVRYHLPTLEPLQGRTIDSLCREDEPVIERLFEPFTSATRRYNKRGSQKSEVATAKALHLLAPGFLPLWDNAIAGAYGQFPMWSHNYLAFCWQMKDLAAVVRGYAPSPDDRSLLKRIDEFNYSVYTKIWIRAGGS